MRLIRTAAVALTALVMTIPAAAHDRTPRRVQQSALSVSAQSAAATVDAFHAALGRGDTGAAAALLADNALIFEEGRVERTKAEYVAHHLAADAAFSKVVSSAVARRAGGSNGPLAWIATEGRTTGAYKGRTIDQLTTETVILRRAGATWKIVHIHWSSGANH